MLALNKLTTTNPPHAKPDLLTLIKKNMKHKKIINTIYNHIKDIEDFDYKNMITDPSECLNDNKDFDEFFDLDHGDFLEFNIDLETFNNLARFAILKKLQRDLKCGSIKCELRIIQKIK